MSLFQQRHYKWLASLAGQIRHEQGDWSFEQHLLRALPLDNSRFDAVKFRDAVAKHAAALSLTEIKRQ